MDIIFKACALAIVVLLLGVFVKQHNASVGILIAICGCGALIYMIAPQAKGLFDFCNQLAQSAGISSEITLPIFKVLAVAICVKITAQVCRDSGQSAIAANIEICGAVCAFICAAPILQAALKLIGAIG